VIKRIVEISSARTYLSVRYGQLVIKDNGNELSQIPCEDIGILLIDHQGTTYTHDNVGYLSHIVLGRKWSPFSGRWL